MQVIHRSIDIQHPYFLRNRSKIEHCMLCTVPTAHGQNGTVAELIFVQGKKVHDSHSK